MSIPSVTISFPEGPRPSVCSLFCNDIAQVPVEVLISAKGAVIEDVGICKAFKPAESLTPPTDQNGGLDSFLSITPVSDMSVRAYRGHPDNEAQVVKLPDAVDDARAFLLSSRNKAGISFGDERKIYIGAYATLSGYVPSVGASPETITIFSYMYAKDKGGSVLHGCSRAALCLKYMPSLELSVFGQDLSKFVGPDTRFSHGRIFNINAHYGMCATQYKPTIATVGTELLVKTASGEEFKEISAVGSIFKMAPDDKEHGVQTFYAHSPKGHDNVVLRGVFHGTKKRGLITQSTKSTNAQYRFDKGDSIASFSWYYMLSDDLCASDVRSLQDAPLLEGMIKMLVTDVYGEKCTLTVTSKTANAGNEPVILSIKTENGK